MLRTKETLFLAIILIAVGGLKMLLLSVTEPDKIFSPDSASYIKTAKAFLSTGNFAVSPEKPEIPQVERTPGYPFFVAGVFFFFGENYFPLIWSQILISLGTLLVTYFLARNFWGTGSAILSTFFVTLDLASFANSQEVLSDTLFTFVFISAVAAGIFALCDPRGSLWPVCLHGVLLAFATLIRPLSYYLILPISIIFLVHGKIRRSRRWKHAVLILLCLLLPWGTLVGGWQIRNYLLSGSPRFSNVIGWNLLFCRAAGILAEQNSISYEQARRQLGFKHYTEVHPETMGWSVAQLDRQWQKEGLSIIRQHPWLYLKSQGRGLGKMLLGTGWRELVSCALGASWEEDLQGGPAGDLLKLPLSLYRKKWLGEHFGFFLFYLLAEAGLILLYIGALFALWQQVHIKNSFWHVHMFMWMIIAYLLVVSISAGPVAYFRFRIPIIPLLAVYAGHGLLRLLSPIGQRLRKISHL